MMLLILWLCSSWSKVTGISLKSWNSSEEVLKNYLTRQSFPELIRQFFAPWNHPKLPSTKDTCLEVVILAATAPSWLFKTSVFMQIVDTMGRSKFADPTPQWQQDHKENPQVEYCLIQKSSQTRLFHDIVQSTCWWRWPMTWQIDLLEYNLFKQYITTIRLTGLPPHCTARTPRNSVQVMKYRRLHNSNISELIKSCSRQGYTCTLFLIVVSLMVRSSLLTKIGLVFVTYCWNLVWSFVRTVENRFGLFTYGRPPVQKLDLVFFAHGSPS